MNPKVDFYFTKNKRWLKELECLRMIALSTGLKEELKWGCPCYTLDEKNIVLIHVFKDYCAFLFFKGALLNDSKGILIQQTENVQSARQIRFTNASQILKLKASLIAYIKHAIEVEQAGLKLELKKTKEFVMADEFKTKLSENPVLHKAFKALTPGRQRAYLLYFSAAKQASTRTARVENCMTAILNGKGLNDE